MDRGAAVIPPATTADPGPHQQNGLALSLWTYRRCSEQRLDGAFVGEALARLHLALADYPGALPVLRPAHDQIRDGLAALDREQVLAPEQLAALRSRHDNLLAELDGVGGAPTVLHGDAHAGNIPLAGNEWLWTDFEETCLGPREWDLATMTRSPGIDATAAVHAHAAGIGEPTRTREELRPFLGLRELEATVWTLGMAQQHPERYQTLARTLLARAQA